MKVEWLTYLIYNKFGAKLIINFVFNMTETRNNKLPFMTSHVHEISFMNRKKSIKNFHKNKIIFVNIFRTGIDVFFNF